MNVGKNLEKMFSLEDKVVVFTGAAAVSYTHLDVYKRQGRGK